MLERGCFWAVAQVHVCRERLAIENLSRQHFDAFFPFFLERVDNKIKQVPLFSGYIFVKIDPEQPWGSINNTLGVNRLLTARHGDKIIVQRIPEEFITPLLRCLVANPFVNAEIGPGTLVRVRKEGAWTNHQALVKMSKDGRLKLLFDIMGREVELEFSELDVSVV
jgi:transcriptional antiterminator RfaH